MKYSAPWSKDRDSSRRGDEPTADRSTLVEDEDVMTRVPEPSREGYSGDPRSDDTDPHFRHESSMAPSRFRG